MILEYLLDGITSRQLEAIKARDVIQEPLLETPDSDSNPVY